MRVIVDTSVMIALERIGHLVILKRLYRTIWIPPAVRQELIDGHRNVGWPNPLRGAHWIRIYRLPLQRSSHLLQAALGAGESEALALATQWSPSLLIIDDVAARVVAQALKLRYTGTLGVLLKAKTSGLIPEIRPMLEA